MIPLLQAVTVDIAWVHAIWMFGLIAGGSGRKSSKRTN